MHSPTHHAIGTHALRKLVNAVLFNISWFCILITQSTAVAVAIAGMHLLVHFVYLAAAIGAVGGAFSAVLAVRPAPNSWLRRAAVVGASGAACARLTWR